MTTDTKNNLIQKELLRQALTQLFSSLIVLSINVVIIIYFLWESASRKQLILWSAILIIFIFFRYIHAKKTSSKINSIDINKKQFEFTILALITVSITSLGFVVFLPNDPVYHSFLIIILAGTSAGSVMSLSVYKKLAISYVLILLVPFSVLIFLQGDELRYLISILMLIYTLLLIKFISIFNHNIINVISTQLMYEQAQQELKTSKDLFTTIFEQAPVGVCTYSNNLILTNSNEALAKILHVPIEKLIGLDLKTLPDDSLLPSLNMALIGERGFYEGEYHTKIESLNIWINLQTSPLYNAQGLIEGGLIIVMDITERIISEEKIRYQAFYDSLTGLTNRLTLHDRLEQQISRLIRHKHYGAVIFIDIDHFKTINDTLGHDIGDELLKQFAKRMSTLVRKEDTIARLGGDEFVILLSELSNSFTKAKAFTSQISQKSHEILNQPFIINQHTLHITMSQGITIIGDKDLTIHTILKNADIAMYEAKKAGRANSKFFKQEMTTALEQQLELDNDLRQAIKLKQFELYFQPIVDTVSNKIVSCEALIRWNHPTKGIISPDNFIPFAEENDLILEIGEWVIQAACEAYIAWSEQTKNKIQSIAINISPKQFNQDKFVKNFTAIIDSYKLNPSFLKLELTESVIINNLNNTIDKIKQLQALGFQIVMDDFGTGYSSLSYLKDLPFDLIKIDRNFIQNILINEEDASLVKIILSISEQFNFDVVAEGVEDIAQIEFLKSINCKYYQGYIISKPVVSQKFEELLS